MNASQAPTTVSSDYSTGYYGHYVEGVAEYDWDTAEWRAFFTGVAERIVGLVGPRTALDIGCAKGLLVQAMREQGIDARGYDLSEDAIATAHADVRGYLQVRSATEPIGERFDLITCTEVLEHMTTAQAQQAIDAMCAATDAILFSSCPTDYAEITHVNTNTTAQWAAWFAERGFFRRADADTRFLAPWAILFERADLTARSIVARYEEHLEPLRDEVIAKRQALLDTHRKLTAAEGRGGSRDVELADEALLARHAQLVARDNVMGLEAEIASLRRRLRRNRDRNQALRSRVTKLRREIGEMRSSRSWRWGSTLARTARLGRR